MLKILVLICPVAMDHASCDQTNALDVIRSMRVKSAEQCGFMAQAMLAPTSIVPDQSKQYVKVVCLREPGAVAASAR